MTPPPTRWRRPTSFVFAVIVVFAGFFLHGLSASGLTLEALAGSGPYLLDFLSYAFPPDLSRLDSVLWAILETFEMALVGTAFGVIISVPVALLAARNTSPNVITYALARGVVIFLRSVPDIAWGLIFVVAVGLGPAAGILALTVDAIGFCGRFFAERIEEVPAGPIDALRATGASRTGTIAGAVLPSVLPSFIATAMFALESASRSAVVLGLVGAGGIGIELSVSMQTLQYDQAVTIILVIVCMVTLVERTAAAIRARVL